jgi:hypothetical protein
VNGRPAVRRRLDKAGEIVLADWLDHYKPLTETRHLILEAIRAFGEDEHQLQFAMLDDFSNPGITVIVARYDDLTVHVRVISERLFTLVRIIEAPGYLPADDEYRAR